MGEGRWGQRLERGAIVRDKHVAAAVRVTCAVLCLRHALLCISATPRHEGAGCQPGRCCRPSLTVAVVRSWASCYSWPALCCWRTRATRRFNVSCVRARALRQSSSDWLGRASDRLTKKNRACISDRKYLRMIDQDYTGSPYDIHLECAVGCVLCLVGCVSCADDFEPIRLAQTFHRSDTRAEARPRNCSADSAPLSTPALTRR